MADFLDHSDSMRLTLAYFDRVMEYLRRYKRFDLSALDLPIGIVHVHGRDAQGQLEITTEDLKVQSVEYLSENAFALEVISLVEQKDVTEGAKLQFQCIPGTERRIEQRRDSFLLDPPFLHPISLIMIARSLRRMVKLLDDERSAAKKGPLPDDPDSLQLSDELDRYCEKLYADARRAGRRNRKIS